MQSFTPLTKCDETLRGLGLKKLSRGNCSPAWTFTGRRKLSYLFFPLLSNPLKCSFCESYISSNEPNLTIIDIASSKLLVLVNESKLLMISLYIVPIQVCFCTFSVSMRKLQTWSCISKLSLMDKKGRFNQVKYLNVIKVSSPTIFSVKRIALE